MVKIIDFGLAKALHSATDPKSLSHDKFVGTPAFASPEQFQCSTLDVRSDIYSLGETLWFALSGKAPFAGRTLSEIHRAQKSNLLPTGQLKVAHVPHRLKSLLESMLAFEPAARPGTHELAAELRRCTAEARGERRAGIGLAVAAILVLGAAAFSIFWPLSMEHRPAAVTEKQPLNLAVPEKSIAVLPFENRSEDKQNAYFADGMQSEVLTDLAKVAALKVISRTSVMQYRSGGPRDVRGIGQQLGVAHVVEGSVQRSGSRVRVNVSLIDARTDRQLWAQIYDRDLADVFAIQSEIARAIADQLQAKLTGREEQALATKPTNNLEAYDAYLHGLASEARIHYLHVRDAVLNAAGFYERAVQLDPEFAIAWARLSRANAVLYFNRVDTSSAARRDAATHALEIAQKLERNSPETLLALGYYQYWVLRDYGSAKTTLERVSEIMPGSGDAARALGLITRREGHWDESITNWNHALAVDPRNVEVLISAASTYGMLRQFPVALKLYDRALDITPSDPDAMSAKATIYQAQGNLQEAGKLLSAINPQTPSESAFMIKITQSRLQRNYDEAIRLLQARQGQFHFTSQYDKVRDQLALAFVQRLAGNGAGAKVTAEQARNALEAFYRDQPDNFYLEAMLSQACAAMGEKDSALKSGQRAIILLPRAKDAVSGPTYEENMALVQTIFGDNARAIAILTELLQTPYNSWIYGSTITPAFLRVDPFWDPLRGDPAFQKLCEEKQP